MCVPLGPIRLMGNNTQNARKSPNKGCILTHFSSHVHILSARVGTGSGLRRMGGGLRPLPFRESSRTGLRATSEHRACLGVPSTRELCAMTEALLLYLILRKKTAVLILHYYKASCVRDIEKLGRKPVMIIAGIGMSLCHMIIVAIFAKNQYQSVTQRAQAGLLWHLYRCSSILCGDRPIYLMTCLMDFCRQFRVHQCLDKWRRRAV